MNLHQILLTHRYQPPLKIHALFAEKCIYIFFVWSRNVNTIAGSVPLSRSPPTVSGVYSGPRAVLHPNFRKICSVISAWSCWQPNQPTNEHGRKTWPPWQTRWRNTAHLPKKRNKQTSKFGLQGWATQSGGAETIGRFFLVTPTVV